MKKTIRQTSPDVFFAVTEMTVKVEELIWQLIFQHEEAKHFPPHLTPIASLFKKIHWRLCDAMNLESIESEEEFLDTILNRPSWRYITDKEDLQDVPFVDDLDLDNVRRYRNERSRIAGLRWLATQSWVAFQGQLALNLVKKEWLPFVEWYSTIYGEIVDLTETLHDLAKKTPGYYPPKHRRRRRRA